MLLDHGRRKRQKPAQTTTDVQRIVRSNTAWQSSIGSRKRLFIFGVVLSIGFEQVVKQ